MSRASTTAADLRRHFGADPFTAAQAAACGISHGRLSRAARSGELERISRGRFVVSPTSSSRAPREQHLMAARAALLGREAVAAGVTAAAAWGLPCPQVWGDWTRLPLTLSSPARLRLPPGGVGIRLGERSWTRSVGMPVTDLIPTAVDVAWQLPTPEALIVLDEVAARLIGSSDRWRRAAGLDRVREQLLQAARLLRSGPGSRRVVRSLGLVDPGADSPPESYLRGHLAEIGAVPGLVNARVVGSSGRGYYADLYWPRDRVIVEIDGATKYRDRAVLVAEKRREDDLRSAGYRMLRFVAGDVFQAGPLLADQVSRAVGH